MNVPDFGATEPFRLLSSDAVSAINSELAVHRDSSTYRCPPFAPNVVRGLAHKSKFVGDLWESQELRGVISKAAGVELQAHPMLYERGHVNVQDKPTKVVEGKEKVRRSGVGGGGTSD